MIPKSSTHRSSTGIYSETCKGLQSHLAGSSKGRLLCKGREARGQGRQNCGLTDKHTRLLYLSVKSRAGLVIIARLSQQVRSRGKLMIRQLHDQARKSTKQVRMRIESGR